MARNRTQDLVAGGFRAIPLSLPDVRSSERVYAFSDGEVTITIELGMVEARWQPVGFDVRAYQDRRRRSALTSRKIRVLHFGDLVDAARATLRREDEAKLARYGPVVQIDEAGHKRVSIEATAATRSLERLKAPKPGRPPMRDGDLLQDAEYWLEASKTSRKPTQLLADMREMTRSGAAKRVQEARRRGFLPPSA